MKNYFEAEEYSKLDEYGKIYSNFLGRMLHGKRFDALNKLVNKYYSDKQKVIDLCCGLCEWNIDKIPVVGLDVNKKALKIAKKSGRIFKAVEKDALKNNLKSESYDIIVNSQALEHMKNPSELIKEFKRLLKTKGVLILAVPYDTFLSLWRPLFFLRCFWEGTLKRNPYFLKKGGHVNSFSKKTLSSLLKKHGFEIIEVINDFRFSLTLVARKQS